MEGAQGAPQPQAKFTGAIQVTIDRPGDVVPKIILHLRRDTGHRMPLSDSGFQACEKKGGGQRARVSKTN
jgi:hypothetical protein